MPHKYTLCEFISDVCGLVVIISLVVIGVTFWGNYNPEIKDALHAIQNELMRILL